MCLPGRIDAAERIRPGATRLVALRRADRWVELFASTGRDRVITLQTPLPPPGVSPGNAWKKIPDALFGPPQAQTDTKHSKRSPPGTLSAATQRFRKYGRWTRWSKALRSNGVASRFAMRFSGLGRRRGAGSGVARLVRQAGTDSQRGSGVRSGSEPVPRGWTRTVRRRSTGQHAAYWPPRVPQV